MDSFQQRIVHLWYAVTFFMAPAMGEGIVFVSVFLVAYVGVSPGNAGLILFMREMSQLVFQVPMGAFVDYTTRKETCLVISSIMVTLLTMVIVFTQNIPILLAKSFLEGIAVMSVRAFKGPFALGIAGHENFEEIAKHVEISEHSGSLVASLVLGIVAFFLYPNVAPIFYIIGGFGFLSAISLMMMILGSNGRSVVNDDWARNRAVKDDRVTKPATLNDGFEDVEDVEEISFGAKPTEEASGNKNIGQADVDDTGRTSAKVLDDDSSNCSEPSSASLWNVFVEDRNLSFFTAGLFFFHLGNAAVLPLVSQVIALQDGKLGIPYAAANVIVAQIFSFVGIFLFDCFSKRGFKINLPIMIGFGLLIPRILIIVLVLQYSPSRNPYILTATQILDGIGAGVNGMAIMRVTKTLTEGTNRFGIVFGIVRLFEPIGAGLSNLIAGYVINVWGYNAGFLSLIFPGFVSVLCISLTNVEPPSLAIINNIIHDDSEKVVSIVSESKQPGDSEALVLTSGNSNLPRTDSRVFLLQSHS